MYKFTVNYNKLLSIILSLSLVVTTLPSELWGNSCLVPPGYGAVYPKQSLVTALVDKYGNLEMTTNRAYTRTYLGFPFANLIAIPFDGLDWDTGYRIFKQESELIVYDNHIKRLTPEGYRHMVRYYGNILEEYYMPEFEQAVLSLNILKGNIQAPKEVFSKQAEKLREIIRADNSPYEIYFSALEKMSRLVGEQFKPLRKTLERLKGCEEGSLDLILWQAVLEMVTRPDKGDAGYRGMLIDIAFWAIEEFKETISCLKNFNTLKLAPSGLIDVQASANRARKVENDGIIVEPCPLLGEPFELWTYEGFSVFNIPFGHNYEYSLLSLLRLQYGFLFDEVRVDYHEDNITARIVNVENPDFTICTPKTWEIIKKNGENMDVQHWHHYLYNQGTLIRTILLESGGRNLDFHYYYQRIKVKKENSYTSSQHGHWSYDLEPDDIPKLEGENIKRILVIEDDFVLMLNPSTVKAEIEKRVKEFKNAGLTFSGIIFVQTDSLQHWKHNMSGRISELYMMRKQVNRIWIKELAKAYGNDTKCQELIRLVKKDKIPKFEETEDLETSFEIKGFKQRTVEVTVDGNTFKATGYTGLLVPVKKTKDKPIQQSH